MALGRRSPLTVAGAAVASLRESRDSRPVPHSLFALLRETIDLAAQYTVAAAGCQWLRHRAHASMAGWAWNSRERASRAHSTSGSG